jgi:REP element-mobilizing transposase RayT
MEKMSSILKAYPCEGGCPRCQQVISFLHQSEKGGYHILSRGNEQRDIFVVDDDRTAFLKGLGEMSERFEISIFAYVLMSNHYHLLLLRTNKVNLSKSMQWLGTTYAQRFNLRHFRSRHLFQGPSKVFWCKIMRTLRSFHVISTAILCVTVLLIVLPAA